MKIEVCPIHGDEAFTFGCKVCVALINPKNRKSFVGTKEELVNQRLDRIEDIIQSQVKMNKSVVKWLEKATEQLDQLLNSKLIYEK